MNILLTIHLLITFSLVGIILIQKSGTDGLGLGGGSSNAMFSTRGAANFFTHLTAVLATLFISNAILMTVVTSHQIKESKSLLDDDKTSCPPPLKKSVL